MNVPQQAITSPRFTRVATAAELANILGVINDHADGLEVPEEFAIAEIDDHRLLVVFCHEPTKIAFFFTIESLDPWRSGVGPDQLRGLEELAALATKAVADVAEYARLFAKQQQNSDARRLHLKAASEAERRVGQLVRFVEGAKAPRRWRAEEVIDCQVSARRMLGGAS